MGALKVKAGCGAMVSLHFLLRAVHQEIGKDMFHVRKDFSCKVCSMGLTVLGPSQGRL